MNRVQMYTDLRKK